MKCSKHLKYLLIRPILIFALSGFFIQPFSLPAQHFFGEEEAEPMLHALLISVDSYEGQNELNFAQNDLDHLRSVLENRYQTYVRCIKNTSGDSNQPDSHKRSIENALSEMLTSNFKLAEQDTVLLYLAGHGLLIDGELYYPMMNFSRSNLADTAIPFSAIREALSRCKAKRKLLILDMCQAGSAAGPTSESSRTAAEFARQFQDLSGVTIIASSQADELSWLWEEKKASLFTYWLAEGLKGYADQDGDGAINISELERYLTRFVGLTSQKYLPRRQTPEIINPSALSGFTFQPRPRPIKEVAEDFAEQIDAQMRVYGFESICIPEFATGEKNQVASTGYGIYSRNLPSRISSKLAEIQEMTDAPYGIMSENATMELINANRLSFKDLGTSRTKDLKAPDGNSVAILSGLLKKRDATSYSCQVFLIDCKKSQQKNALSLIGMLDSPNEIAESGNSIIVSSTNPNSAESPFQEQIQEILEETPNEQPLKTNRRNGQEIVATGRHLLECDENPWKVEIRTRPQNSNDAYELRPFTFRNGECHVTLNRGEEYCIRFRNQFSEDVKVKILVDGLSVLATHVRTQNSKGFEVIEKTQSGKTYEFAPRTDLTDAPAFLFSAHTYDDIRGFRGYYGGCTEGTWNSMERRGFQLPEKRTGAANDYFSANFTIVDAEQSFAARSGFSKELGIITIAIYEVKKEEAARPESAFTFGGQVATGGKRYEYDESQTTETKTGAMLASFSIHYGMD